MKKRIVINQPRASYYVGGAEMVSIEHAKAFLSLGHKVSFITIMPESIKQCYSVQYSVFKDTFSDVEFVELLQNSKSLPWYGIDPGENRDRWNVESLFYNSPLYDYLNHVDQSIDLMLSYYKLDALIVPQATVRNNSLYLCGVPKHSNVFMSGFLAMYDTVGAITDETGEYWRNYTDKPISITPTGIDTFRFTPRVKGVCIDQRKIKIVFLGRLIKRKGCAILLNALLLMSDDDLLRINITIAGEGPQITYLRSLAKKLQGKVTINFIGLTNEPERILGTADICVSPSLYGEGMQGVVLEAMASGAYTIATSTPTNNVLLADGRGITVPSGDIVALSDAIHNAIENGELRKNASLQARNYVIINHNWNQICKKIIKEMVCK